MIVWLHDRKTEHFKALSQGCHASALADHVISTGHNIKGDHFDILTTGKSGGGGGGSSSK